jgi:hypothetical protein
LKKKILVTLLAIVTILAIAIWKTKKNWILYYNEYFATHIYDAAPNASEKFIIAFEPGDDNHFKPAIFLKKLLNAAFSDYEVVYDNNATKPNLVVRDKWINHKDVGLRANVIVPYISISGEPESLGKSKYKPYGLPFAELVSTTPLKERELYFPYIGWGEIKIVEPRKNNFNSALKSVIYVSSNCTVEREKLFALLKKTKLPHIDALGSCSNSEHAKIPGGYTGQALNDVYAQYQFVFAMENCQKPGYITEKIVNAFNSGAIPIYWGDSATVNKFFNKDAFVNVADFKSLADAAAYIEKLSLDPARLQAMHEQEIYRNGVKSDLLAMDSDNNPYVLEQAKKIRNLYDKYLARHKNSKKNN